MSSGSVDADAPVGDRLVAAANAAGRSDVLPLKILGLRIVSLSPSGGVPGQTVNMTITGEYLDGVTAVDFSPAAGIRVSNLAAKSTQVTVTVAIDATAALGSRQVTVVTDGGRSNSLPFAVASPVPVISNAAISQELPAAGGLSMIVSLDWEDADGDLANGYTNQGLWALPRLVMWFAGGANTDQALGCQTANNYQALGGESLIGSREGQTRGSIRVNWSIQGRSVELTPAQRDRYPVSITLSDRNGHAATVTVPVRYWACR